MSGVNYAHGVPMGRNNEPFNTLGIPPAVKAIALSQTGSTNASSSSVIGLSANTTAIEIAAGGAAIIMRWVPVTEASASIATTSFDHAIPAGTVRRFVVPIEVNNAQGYSSMVGLNIENGLYKSIALVGHAGAPASVLVTQYGSSNSY